MRRLAPLVVALALVLAGCGGTATTDTPALTPTSGTDAPAGDTDTPTSTPAFSYEDPESDRLGWEEGYWHNESIDVDQSDGVSQAELNATVARAMARVEVVRGLEFKESVPVEIMSRSEFASDNTTYNETFRTFDDTKFEAMFLIGEDEDSLAVQQQNRGTNVLGYYSPAEDAIVIITDSESEPRIDEYTLGHELVHALQDQYFDIGSVRSQTRDGANANSGVIEGDARFSEYRYEDRCGDGGSWTGTCLTPESSGGGGGSGPQNMGVYFLNYQPYSDGPAFIAAQFRKGGWDAVNDVYESFPESAEQVIDPSRYDEDAPTNASLDDRQSDAWERVRPPNRADYGTVGQSGVGAMFAYTLYTDRSAQPVIRPDDFLNYSGNQISSFDPLKFDFAAAEGWDGDRMHFYTNDAGETGYVWRLVWDSPGDASEFADSYRRLLAYWGAEQVGENTYRIPEGESPFADTFRLRVDGDTVTIVNAPTTDQLTEVRASGSAGA